MRIHAILFALLLLLGPGVNGEQFGLDITQNKDTVYFRSTAQLEFIEGKTNTLEGSFTFDPNNLPAGATGVLQCDLRTLRTGIETRDGHMRDRHLHTDKYPYAYFQLESVEGLPARLEPGSTYQATARGFFYIHGVKRQIAPALTVTLHKQGEAQLLATRAKFEIKLDDYKINRPKALFLKLAETIEVEVAFSALSNMSSTPVSLPDWPELK